VGKAFFRVHAGEDAEEAAIERSGVGDARVASISDQTEAKAAMRISAVTMRAAVARRAAP
jgi:hypothetical protein